MICYDIFRVIGQYVCIYMRPDSIKRWANGGTTWQLYEVRVWISPWFILTIYKYINVL